MLEVRSSSGTGGAPVPALLNSRSSRPKASRTVSNSEATRDRVADVGRNYGTTRDPGLACQGGAVASSCSWRRPGDDRGEPASTSARATARPIPLPAPVTSAILAPSVIRFLPLLRRNMHAGAPPDQSPVRSARLP